MPTIIRLLRQGILLGDAKAENAKVSDGINQSGNWSALVPSNSRVAELIEDNDTVEILYNGVSLMVGRVNKINRKYIDGKSITISGYNALDDLYKFVDASHWSNNEPIIYPLARILRHYGWTLDDISTMEDPFKQTTLDVRGESNSASQILKLLKSNRLSNFRYNGNSGIDVGRFNELSGGYLFTDPSPTLKEPSSSTGIITSLTVTEDSQDLISAIVPYGGSYKPLGAGNQKEDLTLLPVLIDDPTLEWDAEYPIESVQPPEIFRVRNTSVPAPGGSKIVDPISVGGLGSYTDVIVTIGDSNLSSGAVVTRSAQFLIKPLHGYLKKLTFWVSNTNADIDGLRIFLAKINLNTDVYPLSDVGDVWINKDADSRFVGGQLEPDSSGLEGIYTMEFQDKQVHIESGEALVLAFTFDSTIDQARMRVLLRLNTNLITPTEDGVWAESSIASGTSSWTLSNDFSLVHRVESYPENGVQRSVEEKYESYSPRDDDKLPTSDEILRASLGLYERTIAGLADREEIKSTYSMKSIVDIDFPAMGSQVRVKAQSRTARRNALSHVLTPIVRSVDSEFMLQGYSLSLSNSKIDASFSIVEGDGLTNLEKFKFTSVYDQTKPDKNKKRDKEVPSFFGYYPTTLIGVAVFGAPDTTLDNGVSAITVWLDSSILTPPTNNPDIPMTWDFNLNIAYQASYPYPDPNTFVNIDVNDDILIEEISRINQLGDIAEYRIAPRRGWDSSYSMTAYFFIQWEL